LEGPFACAPGCLRGRLPQSVSSIHLLREYIASFPSSCLGTQCLVKLQLHGLAAFECCILPRGGLERRVASLQPRRDGAYPDLLQRPDPQLSLDHSPGLKRCRTALRNGGPPFGCRRQDVLRRGPDRLTGGNRGRRWGGDVVHQFGHRTQLLGRGRARTSLRLAGARRIAGGAEDRRPFRAAERTGRRSVDGTGPCLAGDHFQSDANESCLAGARFRA